MLRQIESPSQTDVPDALGTDFTRRLETALDAADQERRRRSLLRHLRRLLLVLMLAAPFIGWRLTLAFPHSFHVAVTALAWLTFVLDVGVHLDNAFLSYLGLQALPAIVGLLLLVLVTGWLLRTPWGDS